MKKSLAILTLVAALILSAPGKVFAAPQGTACHSLTARMEQTPPGPFFLSSFPQAPAGPLANAAFLYDNALTAIALIACGQVEQARRIGDAISLSLDRDRFWHDGRLRNAYAAGIVMEGQVKLPGWWDSARNAWIEDRYQVASDNGNMAWAMLALLTLDQRAADGKYLNAAIRLGDWTAKFRDSRGTGGYKGGVFGHEPNPALIEWKSTEHNVDLYAAYSLLYRRTGDKQWQERAAIAGTFVESMWSDQCGCFATGTNEDGVTLNRFLALDAQTWPPLAIPSQANRSETLWERALPRLRFRQGYAYSEALNGIWTEGTAQVALFASLFGHKSDTEALISALDSMRTPDGGYFASDVAALPTGFMLETDPGKPRQYFRLSHLGATAWVALAETGFNPFTTGSTAHP